MKQIAVQVISNRRVAPGMFLIWVEAAEIALAAKPGQFVMVQCGEDAVLRRPLSVHSIYGDNLALLFALRGKGTEWLAQRKKGDAVDIFGAMGNGFTIRPKAKNLLLVAGGIGIAPLCYLAEKGIWTNKNVTILLGAASAKQLYPRKYLPPDTEVVIATDDGSAGHKGLVTDLLGEYAAAADQIAVCGPLPMYKFMADNRKKLGIQGKAVHVSMEMRMGCGVGVCYGCTIRTKNGLKQACKDGPVFGLDEIVWDELTRIEWEISITK
jgi:dihydroorotate dehydrogenase electron transfer subunit